MDVFKIWSGNYQKEGYDSGIEDNKNNKPNLAGIKFFKATNPINWFWNFNRAYDTFVKGYKDGYLDGDRVSNQIYTKENIMKLDEGHGLETNVEKSKIDTNKKSYNSVSNVKQTTANSLFQNFTQSFTTQRDLAEYFINQLFKIGNEIEEIDNEFFESLTKMKVEGQFEGFIQKILFTYEKEIFPIIEELKEQMTSDIQFLSEEQEKLQESIKLYEQGD